MNCKKLIISKVESMKLYGLYKSNDSSDQETPI